MSFESTKVTILRDLFFVGSRFREFLGCSALIFSLNFPKKFLFYFNTLEKILRFPKENINI